MSRSKDIMEHSAKVVQAKHSRKYSKEAQDFISNKMHKMKGEDRPQDQKVAIAMSYARKKGLKVPNK